MKVLHVCFNDIEGGAARAAFRLHKAQIKAGIQSSILVVNKSSDDLNVIGISKYKKIYIKVLNYLSRKILNLQKDDNNTHCSLNFFSSTVSNDINRFNPDIVNLHWIGNDMLSIKELTKISKPIVWTFHDMWSICGSEHYESMNNSGRYIDYSTIARDSESSGLDINKYLAEYKNKYWKNLKLNIVSPSNWLASCCSNSKIMKGKDITVINNCIDHDIYKPYDKFFARTALNLPLEKKLILFGAMASTSDPRKGYKYLTEALNELNLRYVDDGFDAIVFGASHGEKLDNCNIHYVGSLHDDISLALLYSAVDVFVGPSLQDNLPNTFVESMACGTPCVGFKLGGIPELIQLTDGGVLADEVTSSSLSDAIYAALHSNYNPSILAEKSKLLRAEQVVVDSYNKLYKSIIR